MKTCPMKKTSATIERLPDCEDNLWYVTDCSIRGVVGICDKNIASLLAILPAAIEEMSALNSEYIQWQQ